MLNDKHRAEIVASVPQNELGERIISLNFSTVEPHEVPNLLNWGGSKWKQNNVGGGWKVSGVNPKCGEYTGLGSQIKLDISRNRDELDKDGKPKPIKYESMAGAPTEPLYLDTGERSFWPTALGSPPQSRWITEGGKKAACLLALGEVAISFPGVDAWSQNQKLKASFAKCLKGVAYICYDQDWKPIAGGEAKKNVLSAITRLANQINHNGGQALIIQWDSDLKGIDDHLMSFADDAERLVELERLKRESWSLREFQEQTKGLNPQDGAPNIKWTSGLYLLQHIEEILGAPQDDFISVLGSLHQWTGTHYALLPDDKALVVIQSALSKYSYESKGQTFFPFAKTAEAKEALAYLKQSRAIGVDELPKFGVPLANGVLEISYESGQPEFNLVEHDRSRYYLHCSDVEYNPDVAPEDCDRMLAAIMPDQLQTWLEHQSMRFDFAASAKKFGRPRAAFHEGSGSNGKDVCRTAIRDLFPEMAGFTLNDFQQYEDGRKFGLATLPKFGLSWSSENSHKIKLDNLKSLMNAIAGNGTLDAEFKNRDSVQYDPACIFHFNVNKAPLTGNAEYLTSRFAIYTYPFTFSSLDEPGKLKADERFAYDHKWRKANVSSALLNRLILAHKAAWTRGRIDWASTTDRMQQWAQDRNHILQFCNDVGLVAGVATDSVEVADVWGLLEDWYLDNDLLKNDPTTGKDWASDPSSFDLLVKKSQDLFARIHDIFPSVKKSKHPRTRRALISGLRRMNSDCEAPAKNDATHLSQVETQSGQDSDFAAKDARDDFLLNQSETKDHVQVHTLRMCIEEGQFANQPTHPTPDSENVDMTGFEGAKAAENHPSHGLRSGDIILRSAIQTGARVLFPAPGTTQLVEGVVDGIRPSIVDPDRIQYHCQNGKHEDWCEFEDIQVRDLTGES